MLSIKTQKVLNKSTRFKIISKSAFTSFDEEFDKMKHHQGMQPAPYLARYKWIALEDISLISSTQWKEILDQSYELVRQKLPTKIQKTL